MVEKFRDYLAKLIYIFVHFTISGISVWYDILRTKRTWLAMFNGIVDEHSSVNFAQCQQERY